MKLGDVLRKERTAKGRSIEEIAARLGISPGEYERLEGGESQTERWGSILANLAIELETPTSRLLAESGRADDTESGRAGPLVRIHRERLSRSVADMAQALDLQVAEYEEIERGRSPLEEVGPRLLKFAEAIDQPVFNLFYPCGLPFQELDDYP